MRRIDLVMHDWLNQRPEERAQAIRDVQELATKTIATDHRRGRALNIVASFFSFLEEEKGRR
jgi:hypothetical protein